MLATTQEKFNSIRKAFHLKFSNIAWMVLLESFYWSSILFLVECVKYAYLIVLTAMEAYIIKLFARIVRFLHWQGTSYHAARANLLAQIVLLWEQGIPASVEKVL